MKVTTKELKAFSVNSDNDQLVAGEFCREALAEVSQRSTLIEGICDLRQILDRKVLDEATNALAGIRHITMAVEGVAEAHHGNQLGIIFSSLHLKLIKLLEKAEGEHRWLCTMFPSSEPPVLAVGK